MNDKRELTIHFVDGSKVCFDFPTEQADPANITKKIESLFKDQYLMIAADGSVFVYPLQNIKSIQVYPAPKTLPANLIKNASISESGDYD